MVASVGYGVYSIPNAIQEAVDEKEANLQLYYYPYIDREDCLNKYNGMYNIVKKTCVSDNPNLVNQTYTGDLLIEYVCEPRQIGKIIIKENCDFVLAWMEMSELIQFIKENPDTLTQEEQDILISKALGNTMTDVIDTEVEKKANIIMWRLFEEGLYS